MLNPIGLSAFLSPGSTFHRQRNSRACQPAVRRDPQRFRAGEGAGFLVLEDWEAACRRGARIYAELAGMAIP